jgi:leucine dehydrogenase
METDYVSGLAGRSGDPSPVTAHGVFRAIEAAAKERWGSDDLANRTVALQGCGHVGYYLAKELHEAGAQLVVTDIDAERAKRVVTDFGARGVGTEEIYAVPADIFAPCALGAIINDATIPQLKAAIVAGAANNQLHEERHGDALEQRGVLYAPDYVANAGGVINVYSELAGWTSARAFRKADEIYDTVRKVFAIAKQERVPTYLAADRLAEQRIRAVGAMVRTWPQWPNK